MDFELLDIAESWSFWARPVPTSIQRDVALPGELRPSLALIIQGVRRCGKSTLMQQLIARYGLDPRNCVFVNFEDPRLARSLSFETLNALVERFEAEHPGDFALYYFLDEIQGVEGWERWVRSQLDRPSRSRFVIAGSNATLLSRELSSTLTGRHLTVELYPFDFRERRRADDETTLVDYLVDGGFPEPLEMTDGDRLLRQYFDDIVERDIRERVRARSSAPIRQVAQMVFESAGSELSLRRIAGAAGIAVDTASNYVDACQAAYLFFSCPFFAFSERKRAARNQKFYPVDTGLRRVVSTRTGADSGKALECATFLALRKRHRDVFYWRGDGEVDFVIRTPSGGIVPIQVTLDEPKERHERSLESFYERFPTADEAVFVSLESFPALEDGTLLA